MHKKLSNPNRGGGLLLGALPLAQRMSKWRKARLLLERNLTPPLKAQG